MFEAVQAFGGVAVKLVYYRGGSFGLGGECQASAWHDDAAPLCEVMHGLGCRAGETQIAKVLRLALAEPERLSAVVFIGDHLEETPAELVGLAEQLGEKRVPLFIFHEITDHDARAREARPVFERMAEVSGGVYTEFDAEAGAVVLRDVLPAVAVFSTARLDAVMQLPVVTPHARHLQTRLVRLLGPAPGGPLAAPKTF
jgi:hypothetical protein